MKNIKHYLMFFSIISLSLLSNAQSSSLPSVGDSPSDFVNKDFKIIAQTESDFNLDKIMDFAIVLESKKEQEENPRILLILFGDKSGNYKKVVQNNNAVYKSNEGGQMGDPFIDFGSLTSKNNSLFIQFYGGSSSRWGVVYQFKYIKNDFYLIGKEDSQSNINSGEVEEKSYNYLTNKLKITNYNERVISKANVKWLKIQNKELISINKFNIYENDKSLDPLIIGLEKRGQVSS
ncbi:MAG: hypothetical protein ACJAS6_000880 [Rickettsiales bacterium]|jgi:hypothetical protein